MSLQDFLVCIEMFIAAAAHKYTFGFETYKDGSMLVLMEVRKEMREAKKLMTQAGLGDLDPGQTGEKIELDEHGHPKNKITSAAAASASASASPQWKPLPGTPEALAVMGKGIVDAANVTKDLTLAGAKA